MYLFKNSEDLRKLSAETPKFRFIVTKEMREEAEASAKKQMEVEMKRIEEEVAKEMEEEAKLKAKPPQSSTLLGTEPKRKTVKLKVKSPSNSIGNQTTKQTRSFLSRHGKKLGIGGAVIGAGVLGAGYLYNRRRKRMKKFSSFNQFAEYLASLDSSGFTKISESRPIQQDTLPHTEYGLVISDGMNVVRSFSMGTPELLKFSANRWEITELPWKARAVAGATMLQRFNEWGMQPPESMHKFSSYPMQNIVMWQELSFPEERIDLEQPTDIVKTSEVYNNLPVLYSFSTEGAGVFSIKNIDDIKGTSTYFEKNYTKLSSTDRRHMAKSIVKGLSVLGLAKFSADAKAAYKEYTGDMVYLNVRDRIKISRIDNLHMTLLSTPHQDSYRNALHAYGDIVEGVSNCKSTGDFEKLSSALDALDRELFIENKVSPADETIFMPYGKREPEFFGREKFSENKDSEQDVVFQHAQTILRKKHLKAIHTANLKPLSNFLNEDIISNLRDNPLMAFSKLTPPQKRLVARWIESNIVLGSTPLH